MSDHSNSDTEEAVPQEADTCLTTDNSSPQTEEEKPSARLPVAQMENDCPIVTQPGLGVTTTTVTTISQTGGDWSTGLFNVCGDGTTCLMGAFVPCCLDFSLAHQYGECLCLPMLPGSTLAMRVGIRERFKIRGSVCEDWVAVCLCYPLAVCQMIRETKRRLKTQIYQVSTVLESS